MRAHGVADLADTGRRQVMAHLRLYSFKNGLGSWVLQRVSALFLLAYLLPVLVFWLVAEDSASITLWRQFLVRIDMRVLGVLASISLIVHATIGAWVVTTDYIHIDRVKWAMLAMFYILSIVSSLAILYLLVTT